MIIRNIKDPDRILEIIQSMPKPQIHYKIHDGPLYGDPFAFGMLSLIAINEYGLCQYIYTGPIKQLKQFTNLYQTVSKMPIQFFPSYLKTFNDLKPIQNINNI